MKNCSRPLFKQLRPVAGKIGNVRFYSDESMKYCINLVREHDYPGYLSCLLFPQQQRNPAFCILAFNQEILAIRKQCNNNVLAGRMRYQWWRGIVDDLYINADGHSGGDRVGQALSQHPVVEVMSHSIKHFSLTKRWFERILETRLGSLDTQRPETMSDLEDIAEGAYSPLLYLHNELLLGTRAEAGAGAITADTSIVSDDAAYCASHFGVCKGLVSLLRGSFSTEFEEPGYIFPSEVMLQHGLTVDQLHQTSTEHDKALVDTVHDIASQAYAHLEKGRSLQQQTSAPIYPYLPIVADVMYLDRLKNNNFDINATNKEIDAHTFTVNMQLRVLYARFLGKAI